jgi:predicted aspartyl protease
MITGQVTAKLEAQIPLFVEDANGQVHAIDATIDTGFSGYLSLSPSRITNLGLVWLTERDIQLIDGSVVRLDLYAGVVTWDGQSRNVDVLAVNSEPLVGMKMLAGNDVRMRVVPGGFVWIDSVP